MRRRLICVAVSLVGLSAQVRADEAGIQYFERHVRPVFAENCYECHSEKSDELKAGLRLDTPSGWLDGGDSGPAVVADDAEASLLLDALEYGDDFYQMPPDRKLPREVIESIRHWIEIGAPAPEEEKAGPAQDEQHPPATAAPIAETHWAFEQPCLVARRTERRWWSRNPMDDYVQVRHVIHALAPSEQANDGTLIRRLYFHLLGLPPTFTQVQTFVMDPRVDKYEQLVDSLISSPTFGERWARHWLDVARFADTKGYVFTQDRNYADAYKYRDWVIRSFNSDRSVSEFLRLQLAADQIAPNHAVDLAAMGFLTLGRRFLNNRHDIIDDRIDVVTRGMMGLTVTCARCHDHKYDPIPTADYYSLYGVFANSDEPGGEPSPLRLVDRDRPGRTFIFLRGNSSNRGEEVPRQFLGVLTGKDRQPFQRGSGRLEMADQITSGSNPLTARVFVNRVWGHLMGSHLVETPSDFGTRSREPEHLELLDYLALRFVENDWSVKWLIREIVLSSTYRQAVAEDSERASSDPENRLYWRMNRQRRDFETTRDGILFVSGRLNASRVGGPSENLLGDSPSLRRTVYAYIDRQNLPGLFRAFDMALPDTHVPRRYETTVPQQALFLMNSPFMLTSAEAMATVEPQPQEDVVDSAIQRTFRGALARDPSDDELEHARQFIATGGESSTSRKQVLSELAQALLLTNEFIFVD